MAEWVDGWANVHLWQSKGSQEESRERKRFGKEEKYEKTYRRKPSVWVKETHLLLLGW